MKKYLLGLFAVILAIGFSAFTKPTKKASSTDFFYAINSGVDLTDETAVENTSNWTSVLDETGCGASTKACKFRSDQSSLSNITIDAVSTGTFYAVTAGGSSVNILQAYNKN